VVPHLYNSDNVFTTSSDLIMSDIKPNRATASVNISQTAATELVQTTVYTSLLHQ